GMTVVRVGLSGEGMCIGDSPACLVVDRLEDVGLLGFKPLKRVGEDGKVSLLLAAVAGTEEEARGFRQCLRLDRCDDQTKIFRCRMYLLAFINVPCKGFHDKSVQIWVLPPIAHVE